MAFLPDEFARLLLKRPDPYWIKRHFLVVATYCGLSFVGYFLLSYFTRAFESGVLLLLPITMVGLALGVLPGVIAGFALSIASGFYLKLAGIPLPLPGWVMLVGTFVYMLSGGTTGYFSAMASEYRTAMTELKTLRGILPICAKCKKIRNGDGYWQLVEDYIAGHSEAEFSHGLCGDCLKLAYEEIDRSSTK
jgi:hypothetical protein